VDSERHSVAAWLAVLGRLGVVVDSSEIEACMGLGFRPTYEHLARLASPGSLPPPDRLWPTLLEALGDSFGPYLPPFPDALAVVGELEVRGIPQGVASSSPRERVDLTLERSGLAARLPVVAAGDEVPRSKPAPDVYLLAAERLGAVPAECLAIEDTATGTRAARAAGMPVLGVVRVEAERAALAEAGATLIERLGIDPVLALLP
jgi:beta-phosphoglucomutase-like phosphatase (HAD superfamily)